MPQQWGHVNKEQFINKIRLGLRKTNIKIISIRHIYFIYKETYIVIYAYTNACICHSVLLSIYNFGLQSKTKTMLKRFIRIHFSI